MMDAPILVGILIGSADGNLSEKEISALREIIKTKSFSVKNDVHLLYKKLIESDLAAHISALTAETATHGTLEEKEEYLINKLRGLNNILPKLGETYAKQYRDTLKSIAVSIAHVNGGIFGLGRVSHEEEDLMDLHFINTIR